jgi:hypothetical protein
VGLDTGPQVLHSHHDRDHGVLPLELLAKDTHCALHRSLATFTPVGFVQDTMRIQKVIDRHRPET